MGIAFETQNGSLLQAHLLARDSGLLYGTMFVAHTPFTHARRLCAKLSLAAALVWVVAVACQAQAAEVAQPELLEPQGVVEVFRKGQNDWQPAKTNLTLQVGDAVRTGKGSRATIRFPNQSVCRLDQLTTLRIPEQVSPRKRFLINVLKGAAYF